MGGFGSSKGGSAPATPDFKSAAEAQAASSQNVINQQTQANRPNQVNAFGATTGWTKDANGNWTQTQSLGGPLGGAASSLEAMTAANAGAPIDNGSAVRQQAINAGYDQAASRLDPQFAQAEEAQQAQLANQGLDPGSQAYDAAAGNLARAKNDAYGSALRNAITNANQAQALTFGENVQAREAPMSELGQLRGFTAMPEFTQAGAAQPTQYLPALTAQYGGDLQKYGAQQQGKNSKMGGAASLAPSIFGGMGLGGAGAGAGAEALPAATLFV